MYGDEVAGEVLAVGHGVEHVKVGDHVFGLAVFGLATHTLARAADVIPVPAGMTSEEAATVPVSRMHPRVCGRKRQLGGSQTYVTPVGRFEMAPVSATATLSILKPEN
jgi:hypothetical protein